MSNPFLHPPKITHTSLQKTIATDQQVLRWFLYIVDHDQVRAEFEQRSEILSAYRALSGWRWAQRAVLAGVLLVIGAVIVTQLYSLIWLLFPLWGLLVLVERPLKAVLYQIGQAVIDLHYDEQTFPQHTLYQIGEHLARQYQVKSLVDGITLTDTIMRRFLVIIAFFIVFMFVMSFWRGAAMLFLLYYAGNIIMNSALIYRHFIK